jgi:hypothetical protein
MTLFYCWSFCKLIGSLNLYPASGGGENNLLVFDMKNSSECIGIVNMICASVMEFVDWEGNSMQVKGIVFDRLFRYARDVIKACKYISFEGGR